MKKVKFDDVIKDITGGNKKIKTTEYLDDGILPIIDQSSKFISGFTNEVNKVKTNRKDVIIFGDHTKEFKYINFDFCIGADGVKILEPINELNTKYLYYFFQTVYLPNVGYSRHFKFLKETEIPLPPLSQQKAIADQLDKAQELVQYNEQLIEKYDELQQSLFLDMFGDPVVNEKGWEMVKFAKACEKILGGGTPSKAKPEYYIGSIPWISPKDMKTSIITKGEDFINENALKNSSVKIIPKNSLLMVIRSGILKHTLPVAINVEELTINQDMKAFVPKTNITNVIFMKYFFHSVSPFVLSKVRAVTADNIKFDDIKDLDYILPPLSLQTEFASHIESIELQKEQAKEALAKSKDIFQGLLQGYFM